MAKPWLRVETMSSEVEVSDMVDRRVYDKGVWAGRKASETLSAGGLMRLGSKIEGVGVGMIGNLGHYKFDNCEGCFRVKLLAKLLKDLVYRGQERRSLMW